jgi:hydrogenase/urease accessory protein HupE
LVSSGLGPFFDGVTHLLVSPDDLLGVIALSLLAGLNSKGHGRQLLFLLPTAWIVGGLFGLRETTELLAPVASALSFLVIGVLVATDIRLRPPVLFGLTCLFGLFHGYLNGTLAAQEGLGFTGVVGVAVTVFVLVALLASFVVSLRAYWTRVAVRVAGSWIAAIGLLMVGWTLKSSS